VSTAYEAVFDDDAALVESLALHNVVQVVEALLKGEALLHFHIFASQLFPQHEALVSERLPLV
jgi:hypothetical protein